MLWLRSFPERKRHNNIGFFNAIIGCYLEEEALLDNQLLNNNKLQVMYLIIHVVPESNKIVSNVVSVMYYLVM